MKTMNYQLRDQLQKLLDSGQLRLLTKVEAYQPITVDGEKVVPFFCSKKINVFRESKSEKGLYLECGSILIEYTSRNSHVFMPSPKEEIRKITIGENKREWLTEKGYSEWYGEKAVELFEIYAPAMFFLRPKIYYPEKREIREYTLL